MYKKLDGELALKMLLDGNQRFATSMRQYPHQTDSRRAYIAERQEPFAAIVSCADSQVPIEHIFDWGMGDLYVIRVAGNIIDHSVLASVEYAIDYLQIPLVMVLGHNDCGALKAALAHSYTEGFIDNLVNEVRPAIQMVKNQNNGKRLENAVKANVQLALGKLKTKSRIVQKALSRKTLNITGAYFDLKSGEICQISEPLNSKETNTSTFAFLRELALSFRLSIENKNF